MAVYKEIAKADGSGVTTFYRLSNVHDTAEVDESESEAVVFDYNQAQNKPSINNVALVGNKTSEDLGLQPAGDYITNDEADAKFIDEDELEAKNYVDEAQLQEALANIEHFHREIVEALPVTGMDNVLYMVRKGGTGEDIYNEYIWVGLSSNENGYEFLGTTATDLTDYYKKSQVDAALATKVDKEGGKGLSEQNYTLAEKTKLAGLENYDDTEIQAEVSGLNTDVNNLKSSNVTISNTLAELKPNVESNTAAVSTIYDLLDNKMTAIRLVEQGDGWVWMNLEGSRLTYAQASAALGHENCMLFIEQLENDGKVIPAEYKSEGDHINVIFKDLDSLVHIMTCGEDDVVVTEDVTTTNRQADFTIEDEAVGYTTKMTALYGNTSQNTTTGKNLYNKYGDFNYPTTAWGDATILLSNGTIKTVANFSESASRGIRLSLEQNTNYTVSGKLISSTGNVANDIAVVRAMGYSSLWSAITNYHIASVGDFNFTFNSGNNNDWFISLNSNGTTGAGISYEAIYDNIQVEKGTTKTTYEPYTNGASPNPDYPQDVHVVTGDNTINICGKNLFNKNTITTSAYLKEDGTLQTGTGAEYITSDFIPVQPNTTYYKTQTLSPRTKFYDANKQVLDNTTYQDVSIGGNAGSFTTPNNAYYFRFTGNVNTSTGININSVMVHKGSTATTFEPYQSQSYLVNLGTLELCKIGNYQDYFYKDNGSWYLHKEIGKVVLDGSEEWNLSGFTNETIYSVYSNTIPGYQGYGELKNDKFTFNENPDATTTKEYCGSGGVTFRIGIFKTRLNNLSIQDFKDWLALNNTITYYPLATPTETQITDTTLISQLNALEQITQYKHTYITITGANLTPEADFTYIRNIVINNNDTVLGKDTYWNNKVPTSADLPSNAQEGEIRIVQDTKNVYIYDGTNWIPFDKGGEIDLSNYLAKDNTTAWIPTGAFNPATKKYVDDSVGGVFVPTKTSQLQNDSNFIGKNSSDLTYYYTKSQTYNKAEVDDLIQGGGGGTSDYTALSNKPQINGTTLTGNKTGSDLGLVSSADVLTKTNTTSYTPSGDYQPATKKYVDDAIQAALASYIANNINVNPTDTSDKNIWIETE